MRRSWKFFPVLGKKPALEGDWRGHATDDDAQLDAWLAAGYGLALDCGASGVTVVDPDGQEGLATWEQLKAEGVPDTYTVRTPRGGLHLYFEGEAPSSVQKLGPKVDTRGLGGYVVFDGPGYELINDVPLAPLPAWIPERLTALAKSRAVAADIPLDLAVNIERAVQWLGAQTPVTEGSGCDARTLQVANAMLDFGLSEDKAIETMLTHYNCHPQDDRFEAFVTRKVENALEYRQNDVGAWAVVPPADRFGAALDQLGSVGGGGNDTRKHAFYPYSEDEQDGFEPPKMLLQDFLPERTLVMLYGQPGSYKSFLALDVGLALAAAIASDAWQLEGGEPHEVVYVAGEGPRSVARLRRPAWRDKRGVTQPLPFHLVKTMPHCADRDQIDAFIAEIRGRNLRPRLVVIDTLARFMLGMNENDVRDAQIAVAALEVIRDQLGCAVLAVHHAGKEDGKGPRGSSALTGGFDTLHECVAHKATRAVAIHNRLQKDGEERAEPWCFRGEPHGHSLVFEPISTAEHKRLTTADDGLAPRAIGAALQRLGAVGAAGAVSTRALASEMHQGPPDEAPATTVEKVGHIERQLRAAARGRLEAYCERVGGELRWFLPGNG